MNDSNVTKVEVLEEFKAKREDWVARLEADDEHSISRQLWAMLWDSAVFRVINRARLAAGPDEDGRVEMCGIIHNWIDRAFFKTQTLALRRLLDPYPAKGPRGVYSLSRLIRDIKADIVLFTRGNMFAAEGMEYDIDQVRQRRREYEKQQISEGKTAFGIPSSCDWQIVARRHHIIDLLTYTEAADRKDTDRVVTGVFEELQARLERACAVFLEYAAKYVAHAATPESRRTVEDPNPTFGLLWEAQKTTCQIVDFLSVELFGKSSVVALPVFFYDQFEHIEKPLVKLEDVPLLREEWKRFEDEVREWAVWGAEELREEMDGK